MTTTITATTDAALRKTPKYKALRAANFSAADALAAVKALIPPSLDDDPRVTTLIEAGFTADEAKTIVTNQAAQGAQHFTPPAVAVAVAPVVETSKDIADRLVAEKGLAHTRGRVYATKAILEAAVRVLKGGAPEVVPSSGTGRTTHVVVFREDSGDVALQNCYRPV